jgi:hypothetical protein
MFLAPLGMTRGGNGKAKFLGADGRSLPKLKGNYTKISLNLRNFIAPFPCFCTKNSYLCPHKFYKIAAANGKIHPYPYFSGAYCLPGGGAFSNV